MWPRLVEEKTQEPTQIGLEELKSLTGKVLVITECTKEKKGYDQAVRAKAEDMYQGKLFKAVKEFVKAKRFDYVIISAKYGLLKPDQLIEGYEKTLRSREDVENIREKVEKELKVILPAYDRILVIAGSRYRDALRNLWDDRFHMIRSRGYGDLCSILKRSLRRSLLEYVG